MINSDIRISVRNLVEFVMRSGDLDSRFVGPGRILEGTKSHQKLQKAGGEAYRSEVSLCLQMEYKGFNITLEGRADGIISEGEGVVINEIKTTTRPLDFIDENCNPMHWAQAKCYAYIYAVQNSMDSAGVRLTYYQLTTEEQKNMEKTFGINELKEFLFGLLDKYVIWVELTKGWSGKRNATIKELKFPFSAYRKGQRELSVAVYKTIAENKKLFVQAPTGIGKTISTLFPAVKSMGEGHIEKIFYLTAKTVTRQVAEEACLKMRNNGLQIKTITLTAKEKICFNKGAGCNPEQCEYAKGHFDRVNTAVMDIFKNEDNLTREVVERYAKQHSVCPFEYTLDLSLWVDCIICDYNYVFDSRVYLKRFFLNNRGEYAFLIDEAHNLVDRAREMFSAELDKTSFLKLKKTAKVKGTKIAKILNKINNHMLVLKKQCKEEKFLVREEGPADLYQLLRNFISEAEEWLSKNSSSEGFEDMLGLYFDSMAFIKISELYDKRYVTYIEAERTEVKVRLFCLDPSFLLGEAVKRGRTAVFFSATLTPLSYFRDILGGSDEDYTIRLVSPFDKHNLRILVAEYISTRYRNREYSYDKIAGLIKTAVDQKQGNYIAYFPSYKYMKEVLERFVREYPDIDVLVQEGAMPEEEREAFLAKFQPDTSRTLVGFGVLGGIFSEGIDLKGERLIGAIIIGVGLPQVSNEQDIILKYFQDKNGMGYEYAYMFPGMNKVLQAAGRVIRSESDRGVVLLVDDRFSHMSYKKLFPEHWDHNKKVRNLAEVEQNIKCFW